MNSILHSSTSVAHLLAALAALITGTYILFTPKGTTTHRLVGRLYVASMVLLLLTAFEMYYLFGRFGIVHWGALGSAVALSIGLGSVSLRTLIDSWLRWHYFGMGASVIGLYASFVVESTYRFFPPTYFWWVTLGLTAAVVVIGCFLLHRHYPNWANQMGHRSDRRVFRGAHQTFSSVD